MKNKKLNIVIGGKGGVGKTAFACALVDYLAANEATAAVFDAEHEQMAVNSLAHCTGATKINLRQREGFDALLSAALDAQNDVVIVDMPAATGTETADWLNQYAPEFEIEGVKINIIAMITTEPTTSEQALRYAKTVKQASFVFVINEMRGKLKLEELALLEEIATVIHFPALRADLASELQMRGLTPQAAIDAPASRKGEILAAASGRIPVRAWLREVFGEIQRAAERFI